MAHHNKFVSVNLNKSYGPSNPNRPRSSTTSGTYSGGAGGMVVLSRPRSSSSSQTSKLTVPPPLNLPSLRKENEKFDLANLSSSTRPGSSGTGIGSGSGSVGWTKPTNPAKPAAAVEPRVGSVLSGEEFPSLNSAVNLPKESTAEKKVDFSYSSPLKMAPQGRTSTTVNSSSSSGINTIDRVNPHEKHERKEEKSPNSLALPYVKLTHTSDWADDERDTGLSLPERDHGCSGGELESNDLHKNDSFGRSDLIGSSKNGSSWRDESASIGSVDMRYARRDLGYVTNLQNRRGIAEGYRGNNGDFLNGGYNNNSRNKGNTFQHNLVQKGPYSSGTKAFSFNDPMLNYGKETRVNYSPKVDSGLDITDPFSDDPIGGVNLKAYMKKKEAEKQMEFHDPVRESFEAELERVQRAQEQERRKHMEQQEREVELIRREQEERERLVREEEDRRRSMDEEAREASWRAEQERIEAARRAEEQKIAREEEKRRLAMEEERRKEAARRKLLELEERIARRQSEKNTQKQTDSCIEQASNDVNWEDGERMVDHITNTTSSELVMNNRFDNTFVDRGKEVNCWKRDVPDDGATSSLLLSQDQIGDYHGLSRDNNAFNPPRSFQRNDSFNRFGVGGSRGTYNGSGNSELSTGRADFQYAKGNRWNGENERDHYARNIEVDVADFLDNNERFKGYNNSYNEVEGGFSKFNRSRYASGQPRVLPPPIIPSTRQSQSMIRDAHDHHSSSFLENQSIMQFQVRPGTQDLSESDVISSEKHGKDSPRCDSQSSLSVSNPPCSPTQLSHDEFDEVEKDISGEEQTVPSEELQVENNGEEDDDWPIENREEIQEHEKYEEDDGDNDDPQNDKIVNVHDGINDAKSLDLNENFNDQNAEKAIQETGQSVDMHMNGDTDIQENSGDDTNTSILIKETNNDLDNLVINPLDSTSDAQASTSSLGMPLTSSVSSKVEAPANLQFGLFSSPPLLSSPIPAIQIGTIQMPLNLLPPTVQFGQLKYPSPLLPLTPQHMSFIQPSAATHDLVVSRINQEIRNATSQNNIAKKFPLSETEEKLPLDLSNKDVSAQGQIDARIVNDGSRLNTNNQNVNIKRNYRPMVNNRESHGYYGETQSSNRPSVIKSGNNGRKVAYAVKNTSTRFPFPVQNSHRTDSSAYQRKPKKFFRRTEFRIRESLDSRQVVDMESNIGHNDGMSRSTELPNEQNTEQNELAVLSSSSQVTTTDGKEGPSKKRVSSIDSSQRENSNGKKILSIEEDVDVPLQSGVVCVFNQPGIEALSDDDNFIQVKSKRQMLIDRREKREREVKAKAKVVKAPRKNHVQQRFSVRSNSTMGNSKSQGSEHQVVQANVTSNRGVCKDIEAALASPSLPPIGTLTVKVNSDARSSKLISSQGDTTSDPSNQAAKFVPGLSFDNKTISLDNASLPLGSWSTPDVNQQVMALTQSQLDDAMTPVQYDCQMTSTCVPSTSAIASEKHSPPRHLSSLMGGERIQFGAVDLASSNKSSSHLEDADSEAEAAASAVAVAAISNNDESIPGSKSFSSNDNTESKKTRGLISDQEVTAQSSTEESIAVSLPADLTVDTHTMPSWHPLPSPQSTSGLPLSQFSTGAHDRFPLGFDMNPMFGGHVFTFGPQDESSGTQSQPQRSTTVGSGQIGSWSTDSFYGPRTGFTGPYVSPARVEAPHHMVVYNHFAPIGQFSQVGLNFMGTTYVPNEKQHDLKHNPIASSSSIVSEGDNSTLNQHLATMHSPVPVSNMPPFKPSLDIAYQGQWSRVAPLAIHSNSHTMPQQQQQQHPHPESGVQKDRHDTTQSVQNENNVQISRPSSNQSTSTNNSSTKASNNNAKNLRHLGSGYRDHQRSGPPPEQRVGYQGRPQGPAGFGKGSKMKQIYVPKTPALSKSATAS